MSAKRVCRVLIVVVVGLLCLWPTYVSAEQIDASQNNEGLPQEFDISLIDNPLPGYEAELKRQADLRWKECLGTIDFARKGGGIGDVVVITGSPKKCQTIHLFALTRAADTWWTVDKINPQHMMQELSAGLDFRDTNRDGVADADEKAAAEEAKTALGGEISAQAAKEGGGGWAAQEAARTAGEAATATTGSTAAVDAVANPGGTWDKIMNQIKQDSGKAISLGLGFISQAMAFDASVQSFRDMYSLSAGLGVVLLAGTSVIGLARLRSTGLPLHQALEQWAAAIVAGGVGLLFTPAFLYIFTQTSNILSAGVITWMGTSSDMITGSLLDPFNALTTANSPFGWLGALVICILFFIAGAMLVVLFAAQYVACYMGGVGIGALWGMVHTPGGRNRLRAAIVTVVGLVLSRPALLFLIGVAMRISKGSAPSADGWSTDPMGTLLRIMIGLTAIFTVVFGSAALVRFMPLGPTESMGSRMGAAALLNGGTAGGAMAGGVAGSMLGSRMRRLGGSMVRRSGAAAKKVAGIEKRPAGTGAGSSLPGGRSQGGGHGRTATSTATGRHGIAGSMNRSGSSEAGQSTQSTRAESPSALAASGLGGATQDAGAPGMTPGAGAMSTSSGDGGPKHLVSPAAIGAGQHQSAVKESLPKGFSSGRGPSRPSGLGQRMGGRNLVAAFAAAPNKGAKAAKVGRVAGGAAVLAAGSAVAAGAVAAGAATSVAGRTVTHGAPLVNRAATLGQLSQGEDVR